VFAAFFLYAFSLGGLFPRLAELQRSMGLGEGELGLGLIGAACGTLLSLTFAGRLIERVGHRSTLLALLPVLPVFYALAAHASGALALFLCLLPAGLCIGAIELVVNLEADRVEHHGGKRIMNRAHAFWSFGFFGAGLFGAMAAHMGISPQWHLASVVPLSAVFVLLLLGDFEAAPHRSGSNSEPAHHLARPTLAIGALVLFTLSGLVLEGAGIDWSAIYMRDVFGAVPFISGLAVATGAFTQGTARYVADRFVERHSPLAIARTLLGVLGVGTLMVTFAPASPVALLGFALMGVGTSVMFPLAMSAAAQRVDRPAATNVAALAQISFVSFLLGPPLLGFVAEHLGIRWTFGVGLPLVLLSLSVSSILRAPSHQGVAAARATVRERK
jgi:MFS family permease